MPIWREGEEKKEKATQLPGTSNKMKKSFKELIQEESLKSIAEFYSALDVSFQMGNGLSAGQSSATNPALISIMI